MIDFEKFQEKALTLVFKAVLASVVPIGMLIGGMYFLIDNSLRGIEVAITGINERISSVELNLNSRLGEVQSQVERVREDINNLNVAVAKLDLSTTSRLDSIVESLKKTSFQGESYPEYQYQIAVGMAALGFDEENSKQFEPTVENITLSTAAEFKPEIIASAVQEKISEFGPVTSALVCGPDSSQKCAAIASSALASDNSSLSDVTVFAGEWQILSYLLQNGSVDDVPFRTPVRDAFRFTSGFGLRIDPKGTQSKLHPGTDFASSYGTPIYSTANGTVLSAQFESGYGNRIVLEHAFGIKTTYSHLSKILVGIGDRVTSSQIIGEMGNSGRSTGTHLHYEILVDGEYVNPMIFIKAASDRSRFGLAAALVKGSEKAFAQSGEIDISPRPRARPPATTEILLP